MNVLAGQIEIINPFKRLPTCDNVSELHKQNSNEHASHQHGNQLFEESDGDIFYLKNK